MNRKVVIIAMFLTIISAVLIGLTMMSPAMAADSFKIQPVLSIYLDNNANPLRFPEGVSCDTGGDVFVVADTGNGRILLYRFEEDGRVKEGTDIRDPHIPVPIRVASNSRGDILSLDGRSRKIFWVKESKFSGPLDLSGIPGGSAIVPQTVKFDSGGNIVILDIFSNRVIALSSEGKYIWEIPLPKEAVFISDLAVGPKGEIYVVDSVKALLYASIPGSGKFSSFGENLRENVAFPTGLFTNARGKLFVIDQNGGGIVVLDADGTYKGRQLAMGWKEGQLRYPAQGCSNNKGEIFIADRSNSRIQIFRLVE